MGIRGLTAFLKQGSLSSISDHVDMSADNNTTAHGSSLSGSSTALSEHLVVIDGNAFSHWFCMECLGTAPSVNTNYKLLKRQVTSWILKCCGSKVNCVFVFDGATEPDKLQCRLDRLCKQSANMNCALSQQPLCDLPNAGDHVQGISTKSNDINNNQNTNDADSSSNTNSIKLQSTPPLLAISCIIGAIGDLRDLGPKVCAFYAKGEADKTITEVAVALKATAIMSNDSDMLIYDTGKVGFIPFWAFGFAEDGSLNAFIIRRRKVANLLGISEGSLPLLAAIVGNDFTSPDVCYNMHKIIFEGTAGSFGKLTKTKHGEESQDTLTLGNLGLSLSDIDELGESADGKRQRTTPKTKAKRSESSLSASDRLKGRRRANRVEEENKRKTNHISRSSSESSLLITSHSTDLLDSGSMICTLLQTESASEVRSSLEKGISPYGESALKTVRAAAGFLKKAESACKVMNGHRSLTSVIATSSLLNIPAEEVLRYLSQDECLNIQRGSDTLGRGTKLATLCTSFYAALEDTSKRYRISVLESSMLSDDHSTHYDDSLLPLTAATATATTTATAVTTTATTTATADTTATTTTAATTTATAADGGATIVVKYGFLRSALRCCFRCYHCRPKCHEMYSGSLSELLAQSSPLLLKKNIDAESSASSFNVLSTTTTSFFVEATASVNQILRSPTINHRRIFEFSPDMEQVLQYKMFIGRTPCSLHSTKSKNLSHVCSENYGIQSANGESDKERVGVREQGTDYVLLQPLRRKFYCEIFNINFIDDNNFIGGFTENDAAIDPSSSSSTGAAAAAVKSDVNGLNVIEIYKKNMSSVLEKRNVLFNLIPTRCDSFMHSSCQKEGMIGEDIEGERINGHRNSTKRDSSHRTYRLQLLEETLKLFPHISSSTILDFVHSTRSPLNALSLTMRDKYGSSYCSDKFSDQLFILILIAGLYIDISIPKMKPKEANNEIPFLRHGNDEHSSGYSLSSNSSIEESDKLAVIIDAVAFLLSCIVTLIHSAGESDKICNYPEGEHMADIDRTTSMVDKKINVNEKDLKTTNNSQQNDYLHVTEKIENHIKKDCFESNNLNLQFINMWTRLQLCFQHVNFSLEVTARKLSIYSNLDMLSVEPNEESAFLRLASGGDLGLWDPRLFFSITSQLQETIMKDLRSALVRTNVHVPASGQRSDDVIFEKENENQPLNVSEEVKSSLSATVRNVLLSYLSDFQIVSPQDFEILVDVLQLAVISTLPFPAF